jgi:hypothetical protein
MARCGCGMLKLGSSWDRGRDQQGSTGINHVNNNGLIWIISVYLWEIIMIIVDNDNNDLI